ncbi:hypothetical protein D3C76_1527940 [compost metagenome]
MGLTLQAHFASNMLLLAKLGFIQVRPLPVQAGSISVQIPLNLIQLMLPIVKRLHACRFFIAAFVFDIGQLPSRLPDLIFQFALIRIQLIQLNLMVFS